MVAMQSETSLSQIKTNISKQTALLQNFQSAPIFMNSLQWLAFLTILTIVIVIAGASVASSCPQVQQNIRDDSKSY